MRRRVIIGDAFDLSVTVETNSPEPEKKAKTSSRRKVAVGQEFDAKITLSVSAGAPLGPWLPWTDVKIRAVIVGVVLAMCAIYLIGSSILGMWRGEFSALLSVWGVVGPIYGGIAGYFFPHGKR